ncbi:MAG: carbohydrate-binding family 9-like protein [Mariniphaga sp.]
MATLKIPYLKELYFDAPANVPGRLIASGASLKIDQVNWAEFPHRPEVTVFIGHCDQKLWLHYIVGNDFVRAINRNDQEPVWQDSCVEFFIKQGIEYRNFEFNSLGVCLSATGNDRHARKPLNEANLKQILRWPSLNIESLPAEDQPSDWSLTIAIPLELIGLETETVFMANFYKCGDETKVPHYISWSAINTPSPDFHRPEYFSLLELER